MNKTFLITMFGSPFEWTQQYIDSVQHLQQYNWNWKIFTPHKFESKGNVEIVPMTIEEYANLVFSSLGIRPNLFLSEKNIPSVHITDFYIFSGIVLADYLKGVDYWGITNMDVVYGRLNRFFPDETLGDIFSDDVYTINGVFSLFKNSETINNLFRKLPLWKEVLSQLPCDGCTVGGRHTLYGSDEYLMTDLVRELKDIRFVTPKYYPMLSHDRLEQHYPMPKLQRKEDGTLFELFRDIVQDSSYVHARPVIGREIPLFHFSRTKRWPLL